MLFATHTGLLLVALATGPTTTAVTGLVDVLDYQITLRLEPETIFLHGETRITVRHSAEAKQLTLAFGEMQVDELRVNESVVEFSFRDAQMIVPLSGSDTTSIVSIRYKGAPDTGLYSKEFKGHTVVYTDSWPDRGRGWLPAVHHPSDPATFTLSLDVPSEYEVIATGRALGVEVAGKRKRHRFKMDRPVPTYSFAFAVSDFVVTEAVATDSLLVRYCLLAPDAEYAHKLGFTPDLLAFYSKLIGPYPFDEFTAVQIPLDYPGMENAATAFVQAERFEDGRLAGVVAHEAAHQWFGNTVVIDSWLDLWLNEGIATYLTTLYQGHRGGIEKSRRAWAGMAEVGTGRDPTLRPLFSADSAGMGPNLTWETYEKGASVLHTLRLKIGDTAFFSGLREVFRRHSGIPLTTAAFQELMEETSHSSLDTFFEAWVYGSTLPTLRTAWDAGHGILRWSVEDSRAMLEGVVFFLEVTQGDQVYSVAAAEGILYLPSDLQETPGVRPRGVMMYVE